jgi:hypothetical protein
VTHTGRLVRSYGRPPSIAALAGAAIALALTPLAPAGVPILAAAGGAGAGLALQGRAAT